MTCFVFGMFCGVIIAFLLFGILGLAEPDPAFLPTEPFDQESE